MMWVVFHALLQCCKTTLQNKIISSEKDLVGIVFFGTVCNFSIFILFQNDIFFILQKKYSINLFYKPI